MTDNEIIKALECCLPQNGKRNCDDCPYAECEKGCADKLTKDSLNLINRQKERIEELEKSELSKAMTFNSDTIKRCSAEAIREFAKFLIGNVENRVIDVSDLPDLVMDFIEKELENDKN